jgi:cytidylate kinase
MMISPKVPVLCLDGPSGSGKGTVGQICAQRLGWRYLDSGAIYRALAFSLREGGIDIADINSAVQQAAQLQVICLPDPDGAVKIVVNGTDTGQELRTEEIGELASQLASEPRIRDAVLAAQRRARRPPGLVADGRDMGTTVFPDATLKIFLTATPQVRAQRRYKQLKLKGFDVNLAHLFQVIQDRDARDARRRASPLIPADDAVTLDTSDLEITEVVSRVLDLLQPRLVDERAEQTSITSASSGGDSRDR